MICADISEALGMACYPLTDDGSVAMVSNPFTFQDGDGLPLFVEKVGGSIRFFDDSGVVLHFLGRGLGDHRGGIRTGFIKRAIAPYGLTLTDTNVLEIWADLDSAQDALAKYISGLLAIVHWEHENQGISEDASYFVEEVAICLAAWKKGSEIHKDQKFSGMSKTTYSIDFVVDGEAVIAIHPHPHSVGTALKKMVDIAGAQHELKFRVVIDDRTSKEAAETQGVILSSMATVMPMSKLIRAAGATATANA